MTEPVRNRITFRWINYHMTSFLKLILVFHPFRFNKGTFPIILIPFGNWGTFIFSCVSALIIFLPIVIMIGNLINVQIFIPELLIVTAFGLIFGTIFRSIQDRSTGRVQIDRNKLVLELYGFWEKEVHVFSRNSWLGLVFFEEKFGSTKNFKICLQMKDGRQVMLVLTIFKRKGEKALKKYAQLLALNVVESQSKDIINNGNFQLGSSN